MSDILIDEPINGVKRLTLNRPEQLNAFTMPMYSELLDALQSLRNDSKTRVVVLTGSGRGFCAGSDLRSTSKAEWIDDHDMGMVYQGRYMAGELNRIPVLMRQLPQPIICAVNGAAVGSGYVMALAADLCIAAKSAKFVNAAHNLGTGVELGLSYLLPRAVGTQHAAEILLTARPVLADEAERIGLVLRTVPDEQLMDTVFELANAIMVNVPLGIWLTKQSLWLNQGAGSLESAIELESRAQAVAGSTQDAAEKRASFFQKRPPKFTNK